MSNKINPHDFVPVSKVGVFDPHEYNARITCCTVCGEKTKCRGRECRGKLYEEDNTHQCGDVCEMNNIFKYFLNGNGQIYMVLYNKYIVLLAYPSNLHYSLHYFNEQCNICYVNVCNVEDKFYLKIMLADNTEITIELNP